MTDNHPDEIDELLSQLQKTKSLGTMLGGMTTATKPVTTEPLPVLTEDNIGEFIMVATSRVIQQGVDTIATVRDAITTGCGGADEVIAYAELLKAVTNSLDTLNEINLQKRKHASAKELKQMDVEAKKVLGPNVHNTQNILVATREDLMKALINKAEEIKQLEQATVVEADYSREGEEPKD